MTMVVNLSGMVVDAISALALVALLLLAAWLPIKVARFIGAALVGNPPPLPPPSLQVQTARYPVIPHWRRFNRSVNRYRRMRVRVWRRVHYFIDEKGIY